MKKSIISTSILIALCSSPAFAELNNENGFGGEISILTGIMSTTSNFNTDKETKNGELNSTGESETEALVVPLGQLTYTFGQDRDHQLFFGLAREDIAVGDAAFEIGYKTEFNNGMIIGASFLPTVVGGETWKNQYVVGQKRETTDVTGNAFRLNTQSIAGSNFDLDLAYFTSEVDEDFYENDKNLDRDGTGIYSKASYNFSLSNTSRIVSSVIYTSFSADGKAESNTGYGTELSYQAAFGRHQLSVSADLMSNSYDEVHSVFDTKRKDTSYGIFTAYEYKDVMGWEDWNAVALAGYEKQSSNINFYDESEYLLSVGINYQF